MTAKKTAAAPEVVDIDDLDTVKASDHGAEIELVHPTTDAPLGIFISILGKDSSVYREHSRERVNRAQRRQAMAARRNKEIDPDTIEQIEEKAIEALVLLTTGWRSSAGPVIRHKGEDLTFSVMNAKRIYTESLWVRRQVDEAVGDLENFIKPLPIS